MSAQEWLKLHFLNVDHGDCTIIRHHNDHRNIGTGRISFVDINDWKDRKPDDTDEVVAGLSYYKNNAALLGDRASKFISPEEYAEKYLDDPIDYYQSEFGDVKTKIWRFISTHPDMDHLSGLVRLDDETGFEVLWDTNHKRKRDFEEDWPDEYDKEDWTRYKSIRNDDTNHSTVTPTQGSQANYWEQDNIQILHPSSDFVDVLNDVNEGRSTQKYNNISFVLKINHGNQAILLPGDIEEVAWDAIIDRYGTEILNDVTILKASHHGRKSGFHQEAVEAMDPDHVILSVGKKPDTDAHQLYRDVCSPDTKIWSTRQYGTVKMTVTRRRNHVDPSYPDGIFDLP